MASAKAKKLVKKRQARTAAAVARALKERSKYPAPEVQVRLDKPGALHRCPTGHEQFGAGRVNVYWRGAVKASSGAVCATCQLNDLARFPTSPVEVPIEIVVEDEPTPCSVTDKAVE